MAKGIRERLLKQAIKFHQWQEATYPGKTSEELGGEWEVDYPYAEYQAGRHIPMTMQDWSQRLNRFLEFNEHEILHDTGRVTHEIAKAFAESEFEKYRIVQDRMFESDFDHFLALEEQAERKND